MRVITQIGARAGEVQEMPFHVAQVLIQQGHARAADSEPEPAAAAQSAPAVEAAGKGKAHGVGKRHSRRRG